MKRLTLTMLAAALAACGGNEPERAEAEVQTLAPTDSYLVALDSVDATVAVDGTVQARQRAEISTRMMARVSEVAVELGSAVRAGQVLIRLGVEDVEANRAKADAAVAVARAGRDEAVRQAARMDTLLVQDAVARVQRDQAHLALAQAESQLAMAQATLGEVETAVGYARIEAPFAGVVVARMVDAGDVAAPGMPLLVVESAGAREAVLTVAPEVAAGLRQGALVRVTGRDGRTAEGTVRAVSGGADPATRTVEVRVALPADWQTGVSVTAQVPTGRREVVTIPEGAVVRRGQLTGVRVLDGDVPTLRWVRLGHDIDGRVEVLSGLEAGERIAP
ncbi:MAG: efflux RND transporter periplasmic adaptor subunit [Longimicrobiales bacterium]